MIKLINTYLEKRANANKKLEANDRARKAKLKAAHRAELVELRIIALGNTRYIRSSINVVNGNINSAQGNNAADTKRKRLSAKKYLEWLMTKLSEEEVMVEHYSSLLEKC